MVTNKELIEKVETLAAEKLALMRRKNKNYTGGTREGDGFSNYGLVEQLSHGMTSREAGLFSRLCEKIGRVGNLLYLVEDEVGESLEDTLKDMAIQCDLLVIALRDKAMEKKHALDGAEQMAFEFDEPKPDRIITFIDCDGTEHKFSEKEALAPVIDDNSPKSILSRFLNFGQARKSGA